MSCLRTEEYKNIVPISTPPDISLVTNSTSELLNLSKIFSDNDNKLEEEDIAVIKEFFDKNTSAFVVDRTEKSYQEYEELVSVFKGSQVFTIVGIPIMDNDKIDSVFIVKFV